MSGIWQQKPALLLGIPIAKIRIFFATQTGTSKVYGLIAVEASVSK